MSGPLFTIGHSNHAIEAFVELLRCHGISALGDVRSHPYSRHVPQFSYEALRGSLREAGIAYVFLGKELGARSENPACYRQGKAQYELLAQEPLFQAGLERLRQGMARYRIAIMCAEKDPLECHRAVLVARRVFEGGEPVQHILADGGLETHEALESRMMALHKIPEDDLFRSREEALLGAYAIHGERIAYQDESMRGAEAAA